MMGGKSRGLKAQDSALCQLHSEWFLILTRIVIRVSATNRNDIRIMTKAKPTLSTIGYEGATIDDFIATLLAADISRLVDVRELPISRRKGFAKTALSTALNAAGIEYVHLKGLGDPKPGREAARRKDYTAFHRIFSTHMRTQPAKDDLKIVAEIVEGGGVCLMCFERDPHTCHRTLVATALCDNVQVAVRHLGVRGGIAGRNTAADARARKNSGARKSSATRRKASR